MTSTTMTKDSAARLIGRSMNGQSIQRDLLSMACSLFGLTPEALRGFRRAANSVTVKASRVEILTPMNGKRRIHG